VSTIPAERVTAEDLPVAQPRQQPVHPLIALLKPIASLRLTVTLFAASMVLVFFGTVAQKNQGIWGVVDQYFWSWYVLIDVNLLVQFGQIFFKLPDTMYSAWKVPFPAGKTIGVVMFANLLAAHTLQLISLVRVTAKQAKKVDARRAVFTVLLRRSGIYLLHGGILLLFVGEYITREFQVEQNMVITEGGTADYAVNTRREELAFVKSVPGTTQDEVTVVPARKLRDALAQGTRISDPALPVVVEVVAYYKNSSLVIAEPGQTNLATAGVGVDGIAVEKPEVTGTDPEQKVDTPSAYVRFHAKDGGGDLGTYLVSTRLAAEVGPKVGDSTYKIELRNTRYYKPYTLKLLDFKFDRYLGTDKPKNYSSDVVLSDPDRGPDREVTISMNHPLRHRGETFYQSSFLPGETTTVLQVVDNPGWVLPYVACGMVTIGMLLHFTIGLVSFVTAGRAADKPLSTMPNHSLGGLGTTIVFGRPKVRLTSLPMTGVGQGIAWVCVAVTALYLAGSMIPRSIDSEYNLDALGALPVVKDGRVKPLGTVASVTLRVLNNTEEYTNESGKKRPAIEWYLKAASGTFADPGPAADFRTFRIENDRLLETMGVKSRDGLRYSFNELRPKLGALEDAARGVEARPSDKRDLYDNKLTELYQHLKAYTAVLVGMDALVLPPSGGREWHKPGAEKFAFEREAEEEAMRRTISKMMELGLPRDPQDFSPEQREVAQKLVGEMRATQAELVAAARQSLEAADPALKTWDAMLQAYRDRDPAAFNRLVADMAEGNNAALTPTERARVKLETYLNRTSLYYKCLGLYGLAFVLTLVGVGMTAFDPRVAEGFRRGVFGVLLLTLVAHTFTLFARMYLMDRPMVFVTNLYSSAVFIGWVGVIGCLLMERIFAIGLGNGIAALVGFATSILAHNLAAAGDTLEMMQAVLDTNFWLAIHVTAVTTGYAATYVAGFIGFVYVALGLVTPYLSARVNLRSGATTRVTDLGRVLGMAMYGVVCFAMLFSFFGTVSGGIWADQSWGRFWGWDPKENGAVLIVVWNALILHARWAGLVKDRGVAVLTVVGIMVTTWSYFGTNQLGVGLHAYGFNEELQFQCMLIWTFCAGVVAIGLIPRRYWTSSAPGVGRA
jgi:ABC-type transport system involved in cytochrome c biogenesis permease subunit